MTKEFKNGNFNISMDSLDFRIMLDKGENVFSYVIDELSMDDFILLGDGYPCGYDNIFFDLYNMRTEKVYTIAMTDFKCIEEHRSAKLIARQPSSEDVEILNAYFGEE